MTAGLMLVYCVVIGDMLVGKEGYTGLLCGAFGGVFCARPFVVGLVVLIVLIPAVSFRQVPPSASFASKITKGKSSWPDASGFKIQVYFEEREGKPWLMLLARCSAAHHWSFHLMLASAGLMTCPQ